MIVEPRFVSGFSYKYQSNQHLSSEDVQKMRTLGITRTLYRVSDFLAWQRSKTLVLSPSFQRRPVWKSGVKSYLIDTIARGLPIPIIFLRDQKSDISSFEPRREVVDGQQRIRTVISYIDPQVLGDFNESRDLFTVKRVHNPELAGKTFNDLDTELKQRILDYEFSVHVLPSGVDDREVLGIFARMNSTGVKLNQQELRNAEYFGEFKTSMYELAASQLPRWRKWRLFTEDNIARMEEVEITSEFARLMISGLAGKTQSDISKVYRENDEKYPEREEVERRFTTIMDTIDEKLGSSISSLPFGGKTLFYSLFAFIYDIQFGIGSPLKRIKPNPVSPETVTKIKFAGDAIRRKTAPTEVQESVVGRYAHLNNRRIVIDYLRNYTRNGQTSDHPIR